MDTNIKQQVPDFRPRMWQESADMPTYNHGTGKISYAFFSVGAKIKFPGQATSFQHHMERRDMIVPNAIPEKTCLNELVKGCPDMKSFLEHYISDVPKKRKDAVIAREFLMTASSNWFRNREAEQVEKYVKMNIEFCKAHFQDRLLYLIVHRDEVGAVHLHGLVGCKFYDPDKQVWKLQHSKLFNGVEKLQEWQDKYWAHMHSEFPDLCRGIKHGKAAAEDIQKFYGLLNAPTVELDHREAMLRLQWQDSKMKMLERKLESLNLYCKRVDKDYSELSEKYDKLEEELFEKNYLLQTICINKSISKKDIQQIMDNREVEKMN